MVTLTTILSNTQMAWGCTHGLQGTHIALKLQTDQAYAQVAQDAQPKVKVLTFNLFLFNIVSFHEISNGFCFCIINFQCCNKCLL
jgi:hypothetical protein